MELKEYIKLIEEYERVKNYEKLDEIVKNGLEEYPFSSTIKIARLKVLVYKKQFEEAEELANELIKNNPGNSQIHFLLGEMYEQMGKYEKALSEYEKVKFLEPFNEDVELKIKRLKNIGNRYESGVVESIEKEEFRQSVDEKVGMVETEVKTDEENFGNAVIEEIGMDEDVEEKSSLMEEKFVQEMDSLNEDNEINMAKKEEVELNEEREGEEIGVEEGRETVYEMQMNEDENKFESSVDDEIGDTLVENLFETYSMGKVYETQGEYSKAKEIYRKLYNSKNDEKYIRAYKRAGFKQYEKFLLSIVGRVINGKRNT